MGGLFSRDKSRSCDYASERGYISRVGVHSSLSGSYANGDSYASHRSYTTGSWSTEPSKSSAATKDVDWASTRGYSAGDVNTKRYAANSAMKSASNERYADLDINSVSSKGYATARAASVDLESNTIYRGYVAPAVRSSAERNYTISSAKPALSKSHVPPDKGRSASINVSSDGSCPTGSWSLEPSRSSAATSYVDRTSSGYSAGFDKTKRRYTADAVINSASNKRYVKPSSSKSCATASVKLESSRGFAADRNYTACSVKPLVSKRHVTDKCRSASTNRNRNHNNGSNSRRIATYGAKGGGRVVISVPLNPWQVLGLHSSGVSREAVKEAFKMKITQPVRQNRAMVSIAYHMLTSSAGRYTRIQGKDEFVVRRRDHFMLAACGHTKELTLRIAKKGNLVEDRDEHGRTLLYIASKSGFYDTCKLLLQKGASVNEAQRDGSTPLHGAAYFGHALVVGLLLQHGARSDIRNKWGNTALEESTTPEIRNLIQTASTDGISALAATLKEKQLVLNVRLIEYGGEVIAKELTRDPRTLDARTRAEWNGIHSSWETAWHGTRYKYLQPIIEKGLLPAGSSGIKPAANHYSLGEEYFGIYNWAAAIFLSPSILYAAHVCYSDRVFSESQQWCVLVKVYCKPGCYKSYDPTVFQYKPMNGEPDMPEYRVPVTEADKNVILRVESTRSVVVRSLMFVRLNFLENQDMNFEKAMELLR
ncbi:hypothetical protein OS493_006856 [Desmophyllum pertusum]|uniref:Uncharacterized protein n=1 Tax=Desmophyllum pertusum TaxID=174260 RepID=A0A9W9ZS62_9CNID|nr:hypothetical protein OS493_006856 [Desmophyllum pertusum]